MNKKVILSVVAVILCVAIAVGGVLIFKSQQTEAIPEPETSTESTVEITEEFITEEFATEREETTENSTEKVTEKATEKATEKEVTTTETTTDKKSEKPNAKENNYEIIYNEQGEISQFKIDIAGNFDSTKIKKGETLRVDVSTNYVELGDTEERGKYMAETWEGSTWYLDLSTKQGCREDYSCVHIEYEDGTSVNGDGFPTRKEPYDNAVELEFKDDCVTITVTLDKPIDIEGKNVSVYVEIDKEVFITKDGQPNDGWFVNYEKRVPQPEKDFVPGSLLMVEADVEEIIEVEPIVPIACQ
jgi:hypothetical protein